MVDLTPFLTISGLAIIVTAIVQVAKPYVKQPSAIPIAAILFGIVLAEVIGYAVGQIHNLPEVASFLIGGILSGLSATGFYEATIDKVSPTDHTH